MPLPRKYQIPEGEPGFYHCISRCVRRSFLCGFDRYTGRSFEHRRQWIVDRLTLLTECFVIDIYAYAIMQNHYHLALFVDPHRVEELNDIEIINRWRRLFRGATQSPSVEQLNEWRRRLGNISWFMRCLNEPIARRANQEDDCKGHFWEQRFKSIALLDEPAILAGMTYVDLNPMRAGIAESIEQSDYTSIQMRLKQLNRSRNNTTDRVQTDESGHEAQTIKPILGLDKPRLSIKASQYCELVQWTANPKTELNLEVQDFFTTANINQDAWVPTVNHFRKNFGTVAGSLIAIEEFIGRLKRKRRPNVAKWNLYHKPDKPPNC